LQTGEIKVTLYRGRGGVEMRSCSSFLYTYKIRCTGCVDSAAKLLRTSENVWRRNGRFSPAGIATGTF